ncbi:MAG: GspH/FimT family pseudopilin [Wenzhouxiangella sp.]|jgi:type IV fimbrial biogenesis protein FimT|nr:GspH/FimT family pseudopilin [Wenzhouxiangella sp.]
MARRQNGFTLIEVMITVVILIIALAVVIPSFRGVLQSNRVSAQANELMTAVQLARSEALKQGRPITICPADTSVADPECGTDWAEGWMAVVDGEAPGSTDIDEVEILRVWAAPRFDATLTFSGDEPFLRYLPNGAIDEAAGTPPFQMALRIPDCIGNAARNIEVARTGRATVEQVECD